MSGKHDHHRGHGPDHGHPKPKHGGPKERELAVALTVAVLDAAKPSGSLDEIEKLALQTYTRLLAGITNEQQTATLPPTISY
jgi:hypothetical protein